MGPPLGAWELVFELEGFSLNLLNPIFETTFFPAMELKLT